MHFVTPAEKQKMDAFSARVSRAPPPDAKSDPPAVTAEAESDTRFDNGIAYFPDIRFRMPGARARLHGTFNLLDAKVHLTGKVALQQSLPHAVTGWKAVLLKPLAPLFRHKRAGAVVPIAVTGTAAEAEDRRGCAARQVSGGLRVATSICNRGHGEPGRAQGRRQRLPMTEGVA